jgi:hypothetical protein
MNYFNDEILSLISQYILNIDSKKLKSIYNAFEHDDENDRIFKCDTGIVNDNYRTFLEKKGTKSIQFDLPYYFDNKKKKTIMIIGMDAKSSHTDKVVLSTPYYLQSETGKNTKKNDYWQIISMMSSEYNFYLTDIYKAYFTNGKLVSNKNPDYTNHRIKHENKSPNLHALILMKEIEKVRPYGIICWGDKSRKLTAKTLEIDLKAKKITEDNSDLTESSSSKIKFAASPHPSGLTRKKHWEIFYKNNIPNKVYNKADRAKDLSDFFINKLR